MNVRTQEMDMSQQNTQPLEAVDTTGIGLLPFDQYAQLWEQASLQDLNIATERILPRRKSRISINLDNDASVDQKTGSEVISDEFFSIVSRIDGLSVLTALSPDVEAGNFHPIHKEKFFERHRMLRKVAFYGSAMLVAAGAYKIIHPVTDSWERSLRDTENTADEPEATTITALQLTVPETIASTTTEEATSTTTPETTTTVAVPYSYLDAVNNGEISLQETSGRLYATVDIPKLCLDSIQAYGSNKGGAEDPAVLAILQSQGLITAEELAAVEQGSYEAKANISQKFDPIYRVELDQTPQVACDTNIGTGQYPARWTRTPKGSSAAKFAAGSGLKLDQIQPVVDIDYRGVAPGQPGNVVLSGHRTTENAALANIDSLTAGDTITITGDNGAVFTYSVISTEMVLPNKAGLDTILNYANPLNPATLTMYSCDDGGQTRFVVRAVLQPQA